MSRKCLPLISGILLLPGVGCVAVVWAVHPPISAEHWLLLLVSVLPYALLALGVGSFCRDGRSSVAMQLTTLATVALGMWRWWPAPPKDADQALLTFLFAILITGLQLLLGAAGFIWAEAWSSRSLALDSSHSEQGCLW